MYNTCRHHIDPQKKKLKERKPEQRIERDLEHIEALEPRCFAIRVEIAQLFR